MAEDKRHIIDRLFEEGLENAEMPVGNYLWKRIESEVKTDLLRKKAAVAWVTAAASLLLLLGLSTWLFVSDSLHNSGTDRFITGKLITLPYQNGNITDRPKKFEDQIISPTEFENPNTIVKPNKTESAFAYGNQIAIRSGIESPKETLSRQHKQLVRAIDHTSQNYSPQELTIIKTVQSPANLVCQDDLNRILQTSKYSEAVVASAIDFSPEAEENGLRNRWSIGGAFSPDHSFSTTSPVQDQLNTSGRTIEMLDPAEAAKSPANLVTAFSTGLNLNYKISQRLGVQSGLFYSNRKSTTSSNVSSFGKSMVINSGFSLNQLEIPLLLQYSIVKRENLDYYVSSGISANLLWNYNNTISNGSNQVAARLVSSEDQILQPNQGNFLLRTGIRYSLFDKISLNLEPGLRYGILTTKYSFSSVRPVSLSLNSGVNYHF